MSTIGLIARSSCLVSLTALLAGCVIAPRDGYHDRQHDRYDRDHRWHDCRDRGDRDDRDDRDDSRCGDRD